MIPVAASLFGETGKTTVIMMVIITMAYLCLCGDCQLRCACHLVQLLSDNGLTSEGCFDSLRMRSLLLFSNIYWQRMAASNNSAKYWVAVKELKLSYHNGNM